jgi:hypothetical protein
MKPVKNKLVRNQVICPKAHNCRNEHRWPLGGICIHHLPHDRMWNCQAGQCGVEITEACLPYGRNDETCT